MDRSEPRKAQLIDERVKGRRLSAPTRWRRDYALASSRCFRRLMFSGISRAACRRTRSGTKSRPIPWPVKSRLMVTRDCEPSARGSTRTSTIALIGPSTPRSAHRRGGSYSVIVVCTSRSVPPMVRIVVHFDPTRVGGPSMCPRTTPCCHSGNVLGSVTYANTSSAGREISVVLTIGAISPLCRTTRR